MALLEFGILLLAFALSRSVRGEEPLPSHNLTLVSKDYSLFVTWLPPDRHPQGETYTVQWRNSIDLEWKEIQHCRNITETICNITCVPQELSNRYWVKVHGQIRTGFGVTSLESEGIDYTLHVELAPPVLRAKNAMDTLRVDITFTYPSCTTAIFQDLKSDLEIWAAGSKKPIRYENMHQPLEDIDTTHWIPGEYCLRARTFFFRNGERRQSRFSEPVCLMLHEKGKILEWVALLSLLLLIVGVVMLIFCYKTRTKPLRMPAALDFSRYPKPKCVLEFDERELVMNHDRLTIEKDRLDHQIYYPSSVEVDDESGSPILYREAFRFQKGAHKCSKVVMSQEAPDSSGSSRSSRSSGSRSCVLNGGSYPDLTISRSFGSAKWVTEDGPSEFCFSKDVMNKLIFFSEDFSVANEDHWEDLNGRNIDVSRQSVLLEGPGLNFFTKLEIRRAREQFSMLRAHLEGSQTSFHSEPENQMEMNESDSNSCGALWTETSLLRSSCPEGELIGRSMLEPMCHNNQPKQSHYIPRT